MSLSGLRKQFNKANQYLSETMGAAEATKLDEDYNEMEKKIDATYELITNIVAGVNEYLQPNPATRMKMTAMSGLSKVRGTTATLPYPQTEGLLSETMTKSGKKLGEDSEFGKSLVDSGEAFRQMADIKYQMEDTIKRNFIDPLTHLQNSELKDVYHHRNKLKGRRLDYDCKKRKQTRDDELIQAEEKLEESKKIAEMAMFNVLSNDIEQVSQLSALIDAQLDFHRQTAQVLESLQHQLRGRIKEASGRPRQEHVAKAVLDIRTPRSRSPAAPDMIGGVSNAGSSSEQSQTVPPPSYASATTNGGWNANQAGALPAKTAPGPQQPVAKALFDFDAQNETELQFKEGNMIELVTQVDENWFEGRLNGRTGLFPVSYVQVVVPLR